MKHKKAFWLMILAVLLLGACQGRSESWPGITGASDNDSVIISYKHTVIRLNADRDGDREWSYNGKDDTDFYAPAAINDGRVYVGDYKGRIHAINLETGDGIWIYEPERSEFMGLTFGTSDRIIGSVGIGDGKLFFGDEHGVTMLDISNADEEAPEVEWEFETDHSVWGQPLYVDGMGLDEPLLLVTSLDQYIYALDPETGEEIWSQDLGGSIPGGVTLDRERRRLYVGTMNRQLVALSLDGRILDKYETEGWLWGQPALHNDHLYFGDLSGYLYEVELSNDEDSPFRETNNRRLSEKPLRATPLIVNDEEDQPVLVIGSEDGIVYAVTLTDPNWISDRSEQQLRWDQELDDDKVVTELTWVDDEDGHRLIIVGTEVDDKLIVALRLNDGGEDEWTYEYDN